MTHLTTRVLFCAVLPFTVPAAALADAAEFNPEKDLISLHYDHAADRDDGQSAAADRTLLETKFGDNWIKEHVVAVSGAYGKNAGRFVKASDKVMEAVFADVGGWLSVEKNRERVVKDLARRWTKTIQSGGDVWVKEGGQSDVTAHVVKRIQQKSPSIDTTKRIHVVQHSNWNERMTTDAALAYTKKHTDYIRIRDANRYLNKKGGDKPFEKAALSHPKFGQFWKAAFDYYPPRRRLDFSDTGELLHILGLGEVGNDEFRKRFLEKTG